MYRYLLLVVIFSSASFPAEQTYGERQAAAKARIKYWQDQGVQVNRFCSSPESADRDAAAKIRIKYWQDQGVQVNPFCSSAESADRDADAKIRIKYWQDKGIQVNPYCSSVEAVDRDAATKIRIKEWANKGVRVSPYVSSHEAADRDAASQLDNVASERANKTTKSVAAENGDLKDRDNDGNGRTESAYVPDYYKADGTYIRGQYRSSSSDYSYGSSKPSVAENGDIEGADNDGDGRTEPVYVKGYTRSDGTYVRSHYRAEPSSSYGSSSGSTSSYGGSTWVNSYTRKDGTCVSGHYRKK